MAGYPIILSGDHAKFEQEWAASGRPDHERPDWPLPSFDATDWAKAFCKLNPSMDEGLMIAWFANALMRGYDQRQSETGREYDPAVAPCDDAEFGMKP